MFTGFAVGHLGRTAFEHAAGHKTKLPVACFGETLPWRRKTTIAELNKHDGIFRKMILGTSSTSTTIVISTLGCSREDETYAC